MRFWRKKENKKAASKVSPKVGKWGDLPFYRLDGLVGILLYVEELQLLPSKFSPSGMDMIIKLRSAAGEEARTRTDSTPLMLYFQSAQLPLKGHFAYREGSTDITFVPEESRSRRAP